MLGIYICIFLQLLQMLDSSTIWPSSLVYNKALYKGILTCSK